MIDSSASGYMHKYLPTYLPRIDILYAQYTSTYMSIGLTTCDLFTTGDLETPSTYIYVRDFFFSLNSLAPDNNNIFHYFSCLATTFIFIPVFLHRHKHRRRKGSTD